MEALGSEAAVGRARALTSDARFFLGGTEATSLLRRESGSRSTATVPPGYRRIHRGIDRRPLEYFPLAGKGPLLVGMPKQVYSGQMNVPASKMALAEYLALDKRADLKHEYVSGGAHAMAGGSIEHGAIAGNVIGHLRTVLRERPCQIFTSDVRVAVEETGLRTYPDVSVVCGEVARADDGRSTTNPIVIVEVLSDSTADWDRGGKFAHYRRIPSLREYVVIAQDERFVEHHVRGDADLWTLRDVRGNGVIDLAALGCSLPLDEIYLKVAVAAR